jgi:hypothetical protein
MSTAQTVLTRRVALVGAPLTDSEPLFDSARISVRTSALEAAGLRALVLRRWPPGHCATAPRKNAGARY